MTSRSWKVAQAHPFRANPNFPGVSPSVDSNSDLATRVIWQDPSSYDPFVHGPPYFPSSGTIMTKTVKASSKLSMEKGVELPTLLALLKALASIHQSNHWMTFGSNSYGDHLLFERLYKETDEEIDSVAEKALGVGCPATLVSAIDQANRVAVLVPELCSGFDLEGTDSFVGKSLISEKHFADRVKEIVHQLELNGGLSRGVDNLLAGIEDKHEGHIYLLNQRNLGERFQDPILWKA